MKDAFMTGYLIKEAVVGSLVGSAATYAAGKAPFVGSIVAPEVLQYTKNQSVDKDINDFREELGLKPLTVTPNDLQQPDSENKLSITQ